MVWLQGFKLLIQNHLDGVKRLTSLSKSFLILREIPEAVSKGSFSTKRFMALSSRFVVIRGLTALDVGQNVLFLS